MDMSATGAERGGEGVEIFFKISLTIVHFYAFLRVFKSSMKA